MRRSSYQSPADIWSRHLPWLVLALAGITAMTLIAIPSKAVEYHGDVELSGTISDERVDVWGNVTVPRNEKLELRNVTLVFHDTKSGPLWLRLDPGTTLSILDGDGDPGTEGDRTNITSNGTRWSIWAPDASRIKIRGADLHLLGYQDPDYAYTITCSIEAVSISVLDSVFDHIDGGIKLSSFEDVVIENSSISGPYEWLWVLGQDGRFENTTFNCGELALYTNLFIEVVNCSFNGPSDHGETAIKCYDGARIVNSSFSHYQYGIDIRSPDVNVSKSVFESCYYSISTSWRGNTVITDSIFHSGTYGLDLRNTDRCECHNLTFDSLFGGIYGRSYSHLNVTSSTFKNCSNGLHTRAKGKEWIEGCVFENITMNAIHVEIQFWKSWRTTVLDCSFSNLECAVRYGYSYLEEDSHDTGLFTLNSSFSDCTHCIIGAACAIWVQGNTFTGQGGMGVDLQAREYPIGHFFDISNNTFEGLENGVVIKGFARIKATTVQVHNNKFVNCTEGLELRQLPDVIVKDIYARGCDAGTRLSWLTDGTVSNVGFLDCQLGLELLFCTDLVLTNLTAANVSGLALRAEMMENAVWIVDRDVTIKDCGLLVEGTVHVEASLTLEWSQLSFIENVRGEAKLIVHSGASLRLVGSEIKGIWASRFGLNVQGGGTLWAIDSNISRCGQFRMETSGAGIYAEGASVGLVRTIVQGCFQGLILVDSVASLQYCEIESDDYGINALSSTLTLSGTTVVGNKTGVLVEDTSLEAYGCTFGGRNWSIKAQDCEVTMELSEIMGLMNGFRCLGSNAILEDVAFLGFGIPLHLNASDLDAYNSSVAPETRDGEVERGAHLRLYNVSGRCDWDISGQDSIIEHYWPHEVHAYYNWSGSPAVGEEIKVLTIGVSAPPRTLTMGPDGSSGLFWLLERWESEHEQEVFKPYLFTYSARGLSGSNGSDCDGPSVVEIAIVDYLPPTMTISHPDEGTITNSSSISFRGHFAEVGSGLRYLEYSFDEGPWFPLTVDETTWWLNITLPNGEYHLMVRISDLDNNTASAGTSITIDTLPPKVGFTAPETGVTLSSKVVILEGFVINKWGTALRSAKVSGLTLEIDDTGQFSVAVSLPVDGPHFFYLEAIDLAGNKADAKIMVARDLTRPRLEIEEVPQFTTDPVLTIYGRCEEENGAEVTVGGTSIGIITDMRFTTEVNLTEGLNVIEVIARDPIGNTATETIEVVLDTTVNYTIVAPRDGRVLNSSKVGIIVKTDPGAEVRVDRWTDWIQVGESGRIEVEVELPYGEVEFLDFFFRDELGNEVRVTTEIEWEEPVEVNGESPGPSRGILIVVCVLVALSTIVGIWLILRRERDRK